MVSVKKNKNRPHPTITIQRDIHVGCNFIVDRERGEVFLRADFGQGKVKHLKQGIPCGEYNAFWDCVSDAMRELWDSLFDYTGLG